MKAAWFQTWRRPPANPSAAQSGRRCGDPEHADAEPDQDDADVLDAVVREEPLQVVLGEREDDAEDAGDDAERQERETQPCRKGRQQREHARRGHRSPSSGRRPTGAPRRGWARRRAPSGSQTWKRHDAGLEAEADEREEQDRRQEREEPSAADGARSQPPVASRRSANIAKRTSVPAWVATR